MTDGSRVTDLIRKDHAWFRRQFSTLEQAHGDTPKVETLWADLAARLEVHAAAEEALFYPRLLKDDKDAVDDTKDAIGDHNQIRDAIRKAEASHIGDSGWWAAVKECYNANRSTTAARWHLPLAVLYAGEGARSPVNMDRTQSGDRIHAHVRPSLRLPIPN
jgi:hypothetical protein